MTWFDCFLIGLWIVNIILIPAMVGKRRPFITPASAAFQAAFSLALIVGLLFSRGVFN